MIWKNKIDLSNKLLNISYLNVGYVVPPMKAEVDVWLFSLQITTCAMAVKLMPFVIEFKEYSRSFIGSYIK